MMPDWYLHPLHYTPVTGFPNEVISNIPSQNMFFIITKKTYCVKPANKL